jgi:uncharacterized membrane protein YkvA (DUF1232 family)
MAGMLNLLKTWAQTLKRDVMTLWFALKHPQTPWHARLLAALVTAYALSPIDLIPDFIPVLGYLDDLILVPMGVWLLLHMLPAQVLTDSRQQAQVWFDQRQQKPKSFWGLVMIVLLWSLAAWWVYVVFRTGYQP